MLQDLMRLRAKRLEGAHELHKFNRDARELLARIEVRDMRRWWLLFVLDLNFNGIQ